MAHPETQLVDEFESQRIFLRGLAYRMLGSRAEAEDVVQEAWLRWRDVDRRNVGQPRAFLAQVVARLCLDQLKSARARREVYVGPWLPEPIADDELPHVDHTAAMEAASDISYAFLLALECLTPLERAAFLLHDVFDESFAEIATTLGRNESACRQLATRARVRIKQAKPPRHASRSASERIARAFLQAASTGDVEQLKRLLAEDVLLISDGGGRVAAAGIPLRGCERVVKFLHGVRAKHPLPADAVVRPMWLNGAPGCLISMDGVPIQTTAVEVADNERIAAIYIVRNPEKLVHFTGR